MIVLILSTSISTAAAFYLIHSNLLSLTPACMRLFNGVYTPLGAGILVHRVIDLN